jgi:fatty acid amide hydrolase
VGGAIAAHAPVAGGSTVHLTAEAITKLVSSRQVSALEVVDAHLERKADVNPDLNAVVVRLHEESRNHARRIDRDLASGVAPGRLAGVPFTVKESIDVAGTASSAGSTAHAARLATADSPLVQRMRDAGAILVGKTNLAQIHVFHEGDNPVYGRTNNPWNTDRSCGGSSAGEGAIIAAGGVPLGIGSDIGGSVRIPAHFCGIHALKPTANRLTRCASFDAVAWAGADAIVAQAGPLARSVADLAAAFEVLAVRDEEDPSIPPVPVGDPVEVDVSILRVGWFDSDGLFEPAPAVRRAVHEARAHLESAGAATVEFNPPDVQAAVGLYFGILSADGARWARDHIAGGPTDRRVRALITLSRVPSPVRPFIAALARALGQDGLALVAANIAERSAADYWRLVTEADRYRRRFAALMRAQQLDAVISPPHALPALTHGASFDVSMGGSYALLFNLLGYPAGVVSTSSVHPGEETDRSESRDRAEKVAAHVEFGSTGLPVGVQVSARPWREDIVLAIMRQIETSVRTEADYPCRPYAPIRLGEA